jgi:hypothetical protein
MKHMMIVAVASIAGFGALLNGVFAEQMNGVGFQILAIVTIALFAASAHLALLAMQAITQRLKRVHHAESEHVFTGLDEDDRIMYFSFGTGIAYGLAIGLFISFALTAVII